MPVPTNLSDLSATAASNSPAATDTLSTVDDYLRALSAILAKIGDGTNALPTPVINGAAHVGGTWVADATWTLPALVLGGNVTSTGNPSLNIGTGSLTAGVGTFSTSVSSQKSGTKTVVTSSGLQTTFNQGVSKTTTFAIAASGSAIAFLVADESNGKAALCVTSYALNTITISGDTSIVNSNSPTAAQVGVYKSANTRTVSVVTGSSVGSISISVLGASVAAVSDPA